jgi:uncharacterized DUF497 family protein
MDGFQWDDLNVLHIARHDVTHLEVEEVVCSDALELDVQCEDGEERFTLIGETARGRILVVIYTIRDGLMRPVTAYEPGAYLKRRYFEEKEALR